MKTNRKKKYVYLLMIDYSTDDYQGIETYLYNKRNKAVKEMERIIKSEKSSSWIEDAFDKDGNMISDNFELDTNFEEDKNTTDNLWWNITCKDNFYLHTCIDMQQKEVE